MINFTGEAWSLEPAKTLTELIQRYDSSSCRECHQEIYSQWEQSHHARPLMGINDWIFMAGYLKKGVLSVKNAGEATQKNFPCLKCHLPQIEHASDAAVVELTEAILRDDKSLIRKLNISCLVCHNEKAVVHGPPERDVIYGNMEVADHPEKQVKQSTFLKTALQCGQCHGLGPNLDTEFPTQCATLYGSYLHAYIPSGGTQTCQECHMKGGDHSFPPDFNRREEFSDRLRSALPMEVQTLAYAFQPSEKERFPKVVVKARITNKAGHRIPDG
jgi:hypothetical protein